MVQDIAELFLAWHALMNERRAFHGVYTLKRSPFKNSAACEERAFQSATPPQAPTGMIRMRYQFYHFCNAYVKHQKRTTLARPCTAAS